MSKLKLMLCITFLVEFNCITTICIFFNFNEKSSVLTVFSTTQSIPSFKVGQKLALLNSFVVYAMDMYAIMQGQNLSFLCNTNQTARYYIRLFPSSILTVVQLQFQFLNYRILSISTGKERKKYGYGYGYLYWRKNHISCTVTERVRVLSPQVGTEKGTGTGHFTLQRYSNGCRFKLS